MNFGTALMPYLHRWKTLYHRMIMGEGKAYALSQTECDVLLFLHNHPTLNTVTEIATHRMIAKSNVSTAMDSLKRKGYLVAQKDGENRRVVRLAITQEGELVAGKLRDAQMGFEQLLRQGLTQEECQAVGKLFEKINENAFQALADLEQEKEK